MHGKFKQVLHGFLLMDGKSLKRPRNEQVGCTLKKQTAEPKLPEEKSVHLFFDHLCCEIVFESDSAAQDAKDFMLVAEEVYASEQKKAKPAPKADPQPSVPPMEMPRKRKKLDDGGFEFMSSQNQLPKHAPAASQDSFHAKMRALDSRVETRSREQTPSRPRPAMIRAAPPRTSVLQRRPSNPLQESSLYGGYRSSLVFGLQNLGNTCYLNAVTQAISSLREFVADLVAMPQRWPHCQNGALFKCTVDILQKLQESKTASAPLSPAKLREQIAIAAPMFSGSGQQDAHEFFLEYINQLHDELLHEHKDWLEKSPEDEAPPLATQYHFDAELQKQLTCTQCQRSRTVTERFRDFSLDFSESMPGSLEDMLRNYFHPELLEAKCEHCEANTARLDTQLSETPRVLVLHLKRFVPNMEKQCYEKQHQSVHISPWLDLGNILNAGEYGTSASRLPARPLAAALPGSGGDPDAEGLAYSLRAIVAHEGASPRSGHYVCYAKSATGEWCLYDDSRVKQYSAGEDPLSMLGSKAYMLFYVQESRTATAPLT